jgi:hypothetical protein
MAEVLAGREAHGTFLDVWHRVQGSNVINDVLQGNPHLTRWGRDSATGQPVLVDFMLAKSVGRIRLNHIYQDTEKVLLEMAAARGQEQRVRGWMNAPGYLPESAMYSVVGHPSQIRLQPQ